MDTDQWNPNRVADDDMFTSAHGTLLINSNFRISLRRHLCNSYSSAYKQNYYRSW